MLHLREILAAQRKVRSSTTSTSPGSAERQKGRTTSGWSRQRYIGILLTSRSRPEWHEKGTRRRSSLIITRSNLDRNTHTLSSDFAGRRRKEVEEEEEESFSLKILRGKSIEFALESHEARVGEEEEFDRRPRHCRGYLPKHKLTKTEEDK